MSGFLRQSPHGEPALRTAVTRGAPPHRRDAQSLPALQRGRAVCVGGIGLYTSTLHVDCGARRWGREHAKHAAPLPLPAAVSPVVTTLNSVERKPTRNRQWPNVAPSSSAPHHNNNNNNNNATRILPKVVQHLGARRRPVTAQLKGSRRRVVSRTLPSFHCYLPDSRTGRRDESSGSAVEQGGHTETICGAARSQGVGWGGVGGLLIPPNYQLLEAPIFSTAINKY